MVFFFYLLISFFPPSLYCCSQSPFLIQSLYLFFAFIADGIADVVPEGGVELGVVTLSSLGTFDQSSSITPKSTGNYSNRKRTMRIRSKEMGLSF